jgi:hypothetical protein
MAKTPTTTPPYSQGCCSFGGLWWGLRAGAPASDYDQHVLDVDITIVIEIA